MGAMKKKLPLSCLKSTKPTSPLTLTDDLEISMHMCPYNVINNIAANQLPCSKVRFYLINFVQISDNRAIENNV